jgi:hypothetical protein
MLLPKIAHKHHHSTNLSTVFSIKDGKILVQKQEEEEH